MYKTPVLELPIYDTPNTDKFYLADWNYANQKIEDTLVAAMQVNANVEVANARGTFPTLVERLNDSDSEVSVNTTNIGTMSGLATTDKTSLVNAVNEIHSEATNISGDITDLSNRLTDVATVIASDYPSLQAAHDYIVSNYTHGVLVIPDDMTLTTTFYWDIKKVTLLGYGAKLNFNINDTTKYAIETINSETVEPYYQATTYAQGLKIRGTNKTCNGIKFNGISTIKAASHIALKNCEVSYFNKGIDYGDSAYGITFYDTDLFRNTIAINFDSGHADCGEKLGFVNCMIYNNATAIRNYADAWINFINCSIDYNTACICDVNIGKLVFTNCHIEHRATYFNSSNRPFKIASDYALLQITNSLILFTSGDVSTMDYVFENNTSSKGGIWITDCYIAGATTNTGFLATGTGYTKIGGTKTQPTEGTAPRISSAMNLLKDGGFEGTSMQDEIFVSNDTTAITTRTLTGTNVTLSLDSTQHRSGLKSLKYTKVYGSGSNSGFTIQVPITKGSLIGFQLFYKKVGTQTGTMVVSHGWCKKALDDVIFKKSEVGSTSIGFTSAAVDWTDIHNNTVGRPRCPAWATHFYIDFNMFSMYNGDLFFDDVCITEM